MRTTYYYFVTEDGESAYRAPITISKKQKALGQFSIAKIPEVFTPAGWTISTRYKLNSDGEGGIPGFTASIDTGVMRRASLIQACAAVDADVRLFAPTLSSRIASKQ